MNNARLHLIIKKRFSKIMIVDKKLLCLILFQNFPLFIFFFQLISLTISVLIFFSNRSRKKMKHEFEYRPYKKRAPAPATIFFVGEAFYRNILQSYDDASADIVKTRTRNIVTFQGSPITKFPKLKKKALLLLFFIHLFLSYIFLLRNIFFMCEIPAGFSIQSGEHKHNQQAEHCCC